MATKSQIREVDREEKDVGEIREARKEEKGEREEESEARRKSPAQWKKQGTLGLSSVAHQTLLCREDVTLDAQA